MKTPGLSEADALRASKRTLLKPQWTENVSIKSAREHLSQRERETIELVLLVPDGDGGERIIKDWLSAEGLGAAKLRHCCEAVGALEHYDARDVSPEVFPGHVVAVKVGVRKQRGFPDRNTVEDYRLAASRVVNLRSTG